MYTFHKTLFKSRIFDELQYNDVVHTYIPLVRLLV